MVVVEGKQKKCGGGGTKVKMFFVVKRASLTSSSLNMHDFKRVSEPELEQLLGIERGRQYKLHNYVTTQ